jgi:hypothetical protein
MVRRILVLAVVAAALGFVDVGPAHATFVCSGNVNDATINDNVMVNGTCFLGRSTVNGSITIGSGGALFLNNDVISGNVVANGGFLTDCTSHILGSVMISNQPSNLNATSICGGPSGTRVDGNFSVSNSAAKNTWDAQGSIGGSLNITGNSGDITFNRWQVAKDINILNNVGAGGNDVTVTNGSAGGKLYCNGNTPAPTTTGTTAAGGKFGQCI